MDAIEGTPDKAELERQQLELTNQKLRIETEKLARESRPENWWSKLAKNVVAIGGVATVAATMYGLYDSYSKTITDRERARTVEQRLQFEDAVKRLEAKDTVSKLVGVSVLGAYLNRDNKVFHHQILFTLASLVATERDLQAQAAVADLVKAIPVETIEPNDWFNFQDTLASQSRAIVIKGGLYQSRQFGVDGLVPSDEERTARFISKLISVNIQKRVVQNYGNYAGIYCEDCDFRDAIFPKNANFTGAVLDRANFNRATLEGALFDNADLGGTSFVEAYLGDARFRSVNEKDLKAGTTGASGGMEMSPYLLHVARLLETRASIALTMPDFSCANLNGARFDNQALFPVAPMAQRTFAKGDEKKGGWYQTVPDFQKGRATDKSPAKFDAVSVRFPKFFKASLQGAQLNNARYFQFTEVPEFAEGFSRTRGRSVAGFGIHQGDLDTDALKIQAEPEKEKSKRSTSASGSSRDERLQKAMKAAFYSADIDKAVLPDGVAELLHHYPMTDDEYRHQISSSFFIIDPLPACVPRAAPAG